jgi:hypothetical protein
MGRPRKDSNDDFSGVNDYATNNDNQENEAVLKQPAIEPENAFFNVKEIHVSRIAKLLDSGYDEVIIHGDGSMFAGRNGQLFDGKSHKDGSDHHKTFNSGAEEINKNDMVSRAKYRAFYRKGDKLPKDKNEIISTFYLTQAKEIQFKKTDESSKVFSNIITLKD